MGGGRKRNGRRDSRKKLAALSLERRLILNYLKEYKEQALSLYDSVSSSPERPQKWNATKNKIYGNQPIIVDGVKLPVIENNALLEQPFLSLPKELSAYQRSIIHDICTDTLRLFHCGVDGDNPAERFVAISIYSDGLTHVPGLAGSLSPPSTPAGNYFRPWITKKDVDSDAETREGKKAILEMIHRPDRCLRDACDTIDLLELQDDSLGSTEPPESGDAACLLVDSAERMRRCVRELEENRPTEIAFDLECYNRKKDQQMTCLIQIATNDGRTYIIDVIGGRNGEVWEGARGLAGVFADGSIVKIGHGIRGLDVQSLQRDFGIFVVNVFDTYEAATVLKLEGLGLASICAHYGMQNAGLYNDLKGRYQSSDWTQRPLTDPMILYGRYDVHYLIHLRKLMTRDLVLLSASAVTAMVSSSSEHTAGTRKKNNETESTTDESASNGNTPDKRAGLLVVERKHCLNAEDLRTRPKLMQVLSKSQEGCIKFWNTEPEPRLRNKCFLSLLAQCKKGGKNLTKSQLGLYSKLASWREDLARDAESLPGTICSLGFLARVAFHRPVTENCVRQIQYVLPCFLVEDERQNMKTMLSYVRDSLVEDNVVKDERHPTFENFRKKKMMKAVLILDRGSNTKNMLSNPVFWVLTSATISLVIYSFIGNTKRKR